jgi:hypothetical protein
MPPVDLSFWEGREARTWTQFPNKQKKKEKFIFHDINFRANSYQFLSSFKVAKGSKTGYLYIQQE